ncbi:hypothetical protein MAMC_00590 [Methylacidimicrobium cyclopophantes]|uniref:Uncharacterized protein n=2 Tax=Methylacidimicrobium cyclopophantes TaxID=1041766 RepID=A0A5E6M8F6_9BACT|nr:hypothetical protein MAMC_00590 [Methylacidimicrobium cyclopophantes]
MQADKLWALLASRRLAPGNHTPMVQNPQWPPHEDGKERRILRSLLLFAFLLLAITIIQFLLGLLVALGFRIRAL